MPGLLDYIPPPDNSEAYKRNQQYARPVSVMRGYQTPLNPLEELAFQAWVQKNKVPFDPGPQADYDMRGYFKALKGGTARESSVNANDGLLHYPDTFKTPYHESFSNESKYANALAPAWNVFDRLQDRTGKTVYDEKRMNLLAQMLLTR